MIRTQLIFLNDRVWRIEKDDISNGFQTPSQVFKCPICLVDWASLRYLGDRYVQPVGIPCETCPEAYDEFLRPVPGSILDCPMANGIDQELLKVLPIDLLKREFQLHLKAIPYATKFNVPGRPGQPRACEATVGSNALGVGGS